MNLFMRLALILATLTLTACDKPKQALPENSVTYGTRTEEGTTLDQERSVPSVENNYKVEATRSDQAHDYSSAPPDNPDRPAGTPGHETSPRSE